MQLDIQTDTPSVTQADLYRLIQPTPGPCVSIYARTGATESADQGRIRFRNALQRAEQAIGEPQENGQEGNPLDPLRALADDSELWLGATPGIAAFLSRDRVVVRRLPEEPQDLVMVADSFHVKPIIRMVQATDRFQVLAVSAERVALYEGDRHGLQPVRLHDDVPKTMGEAIGEPSRLTEESGNGAVSNQGGHDLRQEQLNRWFRRLDQAIWERHSREAQLPMILAAQDQYHSFFHMAAHNRNLLKDAAIKRDPFKDIDLELLSRLAVEQMQPIWDASIAELMELFGSAKAHGKGNDQVNDIAAQAAIGRVGTLILEEGRHVGGAVEPGTGKVTFRAIGDPHTDDLLDDLAEMVLRAGGQVMVLPREKMPTEHGVAAIYRY